MIVECPGCHLRYDVSGRPPNTSARCRCGTVFRLPDPPETAGALSCPQCGAAAAPHEPRCAYCQTVLATVRCPRCFGLLFRGANHCQHCGAKVGAPARAMTEDGGSQRHCPRCSRPMVANLAGDVLVDQCNDCGGLWVDQTAFERILDEREQQQSAQAALGAFPPPRNAVTPHQVTYLKCPDCDTVMNRQNFGKRSGIIVDLCKSHGIWFDHGELPRIIEFVRGGGLQEARRRELEELKEQARAERHKALSAQMRAQMTGTYPDEPLFGRRASGIFNVADFLAALFK